MRLRNPLVWGVGVIGIAVIAWLAFGYFGIQTAFIDQSVDEDFPVVAANTEAQPEPTIIPATPEPQPTVDTTSDQPTADQPTTIPATPEPQPTSTPAGPVLVRSGSFHAVDHNGVGQALIFQQPDGSYILRFEDFDIENGPDLFVYTVAVPDATDSSIVKNSDYLNIARLKGNQGNQNYELPADFDPNTYTTITIWCERFGVNMVSAPLQVP